MEDLQQHLADNAELVAQRVQLGDRPEVRRQVDHTALVPKKSVDAVAADLAAAGFRVDSVRKGLRRATVAFSQEQSADLETANAVTTRLVELLARHDATYDGWASFLVDDPAV